MARQRNNIAKLPWDCREVVCRLRFDGASNAEIERGVHAKCRELEIDAPAIHGTSILAYEKSAEYKRYCDRRREWDAKIEPRRWAAKLINDGRGPQSVADMAELAILEQLYDLAEGGLLETGKDVATVARAITSMQRTQIARREAEEKDRIEAIEEEHAAEVATLQADNKAMFEELEAAEAEVDRLTELCQRAGIDTSGVRKGDLSDAARARIRQIYGIKK